MIRGWPTLVAVAVPVVVACSSSGTGNPFTDGGTAGSAGTGHGGSAGSTAGSGGSGQGGASGSGVGGAGGCPPCVGPPSPDCVGMGPCGCGPYVCPDTLACPDGSTMGPFERSCGSASDCSVALHQTDCCGTLTALGVASSALAEFTTAEAACSAGYPGWGCPAGPITTEDGGEVSTADAVVAVCSEGACRTTTVP